MKRVKSNEGFTLIEMAVVLVIAAMLLVPILNGLNIYLKQKRINDTTRNITQVEQELAKFVAANNRLPCPASLISPEMDANHGREVTGCSTATGGIFVVPSAIAGRQVVIGAVPFKTLGLGGVPMSLSKDGWGRRLTYAVTLQATTAPPPPQGFDSTVGGISVIDANDVNALGNTLENRALYAIVSHGESGMGAYTSSGALVQACEAGRTESENCDHMNATFRIADISIGTVANYTDDVIFSRTALVVPDDVDDALPSCGAGQYLTTSNGQAVCVNLPPPPNVPVIPTCAAGEVLQGTGSGYTCIRIADILCTAIGSPGDTLGLNSGVVSCVNAYSAATNPPGQ